jgi:hypothetical protein
MKKKWLGVALGVCLVAGGFGVRKLTRRSTRPAVTEVTAAAPAGRTAQSLEIGEALYDGKLVAGWDDWGWGPHQLATGPARVVFEGYGGIIFHHGELAWRYGGLAFRYRAPSEFGSFLQVQLRWQSAPDDAFRLVPVEPRHVVALADGWKEVLIDWKELNPEQRAFDRVFITSAKSVPSDWVLIDHVFLTRPPGALPEPTGGREAALRVICDGASHPIPSLIYGAASDEWSSGMSAKRMGGNTYSRFNWELGAWNTGKDWFFENVSQKGSLFDVLDTAAKQKQPLVLAVPTLGWVAKDATSFGFPKDKFKDQAKFDGYRPDAGNGVRADATPIPPGAPEQTSMPAPPELIQQWVQKVVAQNDARGSRSVVMYILDNEPSLWNETHRDVHPNPLGYDELLDRTAKYAEAIRTADPEALIAGPAEWGWLGYMYSGKDREAGIPKQPDRKAHGDVPLVPWLLRKIAGRENETGKRLLDALDLHFYPAGDSVYGPATDSATVELRLRSTRALWDPSYVDESWIKEPIALIPRMKEWVNQNHPGLKLSIGEWCFGAEQHISGGLATAEALGRFGQQGLDSAFFWGDLKQGNPTYWAFRAYRNFDGKGARFQDISLPVQETENVSLFASRDEEAKHIVLVLINRDGRSSANAQIELQGCGNVTSSRLFRYGVGSLDLSEGKVEQTGTGVKSLLEAYSLSVIDLTVDAASGR